MAPKRKHPQSQGLPPGARLKRDRLPGALGSAWAWVGTEVLDPSDITQDHLRAACGFSGRNGHKFCANKYSPALALDKRKIHDVSEATEDHAVIISDEEVPPCNEKMCKSNPNCLNYVGQPAWEDDGKFQLPCMHRFLTVCSLLR